MKNTPTEKQKNFLPLLLICTLAPVYLELALHLFVYGELSARIVYPILFAVSTGLLFFALCTLLPGKAGRIVLISLAALVTLYFEVQYVYNSIFGEFMSLWQVSFGAEAITNFHKQLLYGIVRAWLPILVLALPFAVLLISLRLKKNILGKFSLFLPLAGLILCVAVHYGALGIMHANDTNAYSVIRLYKNANTATEISVKNIGLLSTTRQEAKFLLLHASQDAQPVSYPEDGSRAALADDPARYNMLNIDFDALSESADNETLRRLDQYFASCMPTLKNTYTGLLSDYNLITICAESFSPHLIDPELTPTLYKLATNGLVFENFFNSYGSNTTNGEYTLCMGIYPDLSRSKSTASFYASQKNQLPFCLGNIMAEQGASCYAYHNYTGEYYSRNVTHPNMGYTFRSATDGLDIPISWPSSDLDMMKASVKDFLSSDERFCVYYMTFSGHYQYDWDNPMSKKNRSAVQDLPYSEAVKAYLACNLELEHALTYLLDELERAGVAEKTCIVLTTDHYPYGLSQAQYNELAGKSVDTTFEKYRSSFICYFPGVQIPVDTYCSTVDILPTLLNLFGLPYDSRLLVGKDVLSDDAPDVAVLSDQSFITRDFAFDTSTGTLHTYNGTRFDHASAVEALQKRIALDFQISMDILASDYYAHAIYGIADTQNRLKEYPFTDIPEQMTIAALDYVCDNGYMTPISDTKFGFDVICTYAEFLDVLYRIEQMPPVAAPTPTGSSERTITGKYAPAVSWAQQNDLINENLWQLDSFTPIRRRDTVVSIYRYASMQGADMTIDTTLLQQYLQKYPTVTYDEAAALIWCFDNAIARADGTLDSVFEFAHLEMPRYYILSAIYNLHNLLEQ